MSPVPSEKGFQLFPNFPAEIRLKIWEFYTWYPRVVEIRTYDHPSNIGFWTNDQGNSVSDLRWVTKTPPPPALSVCRELRVEAKKIWSFRFQLHPGGGGEIIHINPILDTIYTHVGRWPELIPSLLRDLQSFSTPQCRILHFACNIHSFPYIPGIAPMLANLDTLLCVVDPQRGTYNWFDEWKDSNCIFVAAQTNKECK